MSTLQELLGFGSDFKFEYSESDYGDYSEENPIEVTGKNSKGVARLKAISQKLAQDTSADAVVVAKTIGFKGNTLSLELTDKARKHFQFDTSEKKFEEWFNGLLKEDKFSTKTTKRVSEARREHDLGDMVDKYLDANKMWNFEGSRGVRNLLSLFRVLNHDYNSFESFLEDNPGAQQALVEWIQQARVSEWAENIASGFDEEEEE